MTLSFGLQGVLAAVLLRAALSLWLCKQEIKRSSRTLCSAVWAGLKFQSLAHSCSADWAG